MEVDQQRGEGFRSYYIQKIEELQLIVNEKGQNLRRLQAQRNELNAKGNLNRFFPSSSSDNNKIFFLFSSNAPRGTPIAAGTRQLCR
jgi:hypothetical protein